MSVSTEFFSRSQAGQDVWVRSLFPPGYKGTFLDIGCSHPIEINNTYALERMGWTGLLIDIDDVGVLCKEHRTSPFIRDDVTNWVFGETVDLTFPRKMDYLSLDVDSASLDALKNLPLDSIQFNAITIEHDRYRFGQEVADKMRAHLVNHGYLVKRLDVTHDGLPFEDWWLHESFTPYTP